MIDHFICRVGKETRPLSEARSGSVGKNGLGVCKEHHTDHVKNFHIAKKAALFPQHYLTCDDCDRIFSKYQKGGKNQFGQRLLKVECPFCGSEDFSLY